MPSAFEKSEKLLDSPLQRLASRIHRFCGKHGLPHVHSCLWDRHCRWAMKGFGTPRVIDLFWGRHTFRVELPGYDRPTQWRKRDDPTMHEVPGRWQLLPLFEHSVDRSKES